MSNFICDSIICPKCGSSDYFVEGSIAAMVLLKDNHGNQLPSPNETFYHCKTCKNAWSVYKNGSIRAKLEAAPAPEPIDIASVGSIKMNVDVPQLNLLVEIMEAFTNIISQLTTHINDLGDRITNLENRSEMEEDAIRDINCEFTAVNDEIDNLYNIVWRKKNRDICNTCTSVECGECGFGGEEDEEAPIPLKVDVVTERVQTSTYRMDVPPHFVQYDREGNITNENELIDIVMKSGKEVSGSIKPTISRLTLTEVEDEGCCEEGGSVR